MADSKNTKRSKRKYGSEREATTRANKERKIAKEARRQAKLKARKDS